MKRSKSFLLSLLSCLVLWSAVTGCGGADAPDILTITPAGSTSVLKGSTLQFSSNIAGTTWTVDGGATNGAIDADGLYSPPATLPIDPRVRIEATSPDGQTDEAFVDLRTGDTLTFGAASPPLNSAPFPLLFILAEFQFIGVPDRLDVTLGSIQADAAWTRFEVGNANVAFNQEENFGGFGAEHLLTVDPANYHVTTSLATDSGQDPAVVMISKNGTRSQMELLRSPNGGASFNAPVVINPDPANDQGFASLKIDAQDVFHLVYVEAPDTSASPDFTDGGRLFYTRSLDRGDNWSVPVEIGVPANLKWVPNFAVSDDGQTIQVCWSDDNGSGGATRDIRLATSVNGGSAFGAPANLSATGTERFCRVAQGLQGEVYVAFSSFFGVVPPPTGSDISFAKSLDGGNTFSAPIVVNSTTANDQCAPFMSVDSLGRIDIIWSSNADGAGFTESIYHARSLDQGDSFSTNQAVHGTPLQMASFGQGLVHDPSGRLHLLLASDANSPGVGYDILYLRAE